MNGEGFHSENNLQAAHSKPASVARAEVRLRARDVEETPLPADEINTSVPL